MKMKKIREKHSNGDYWKEVILPDSPICFFIGTSAYPFIYGLQQCIPTTIQGTTSASLKIQI